MDSITKDPREVIAARILKMDDQIDDFPVGDDEQNGLVKNIGVLAKALSDLESGRIQEEDNIAKREEQQRINDKEIELKESQIKNDAERLELEKARRAQDLKLDLIHIVCQSALNATAQIGYFGMARRTAAHEYRVSDGSSITPPRDVVNANNKLERFIGTNKKF